MSLRKGQIRPVVIVGGARIPFCRSNTSYTDISNQELMTASLKALVEKFNLKGETIGDVTCGAVIAHSSDWNLSREAVLGSGLAPETPAFDTRRACGTSLEAAILMATKIATGQIDCGIAGGVESLTDVPVVFRRSFARRVLKIPRAKSLGEKLALWKGFSYGDLKPVFPGVTEPRTGLSMGDHCELMAKEWKVTQKEQDELAFESHMKAHAAYERGFFKDIVFPFRGVTKDNIVRGDTTPEKLAKLKPAFDKSGKGTLTAGNSTALTDGSSAVLLATEEWAKSRGLPILAYFTDSHISAVNFSKEGLLMAPAYAVPKLLEKVSMKLQDFDFYEIHEAFAAQVLCTLKAWESEEFCKERLGLKSALGKIDRKKLNVTGGSLALGHPFGATGARLVGSAAKLLAEKGSGKVLLSVCTGGGMGVTAVLER